MGRGRSQQRKDLVEAAREILATIEPAPVRAVCYQLFDHKLIASMAKRDTDRVSEFLVRAREEGSIPWAWIVQEDRPIEKAPTYTDPAAFARIVQRSYSRDKWQAQRRRLLVVSEKATVRGTLHPVLEALEVDHIYVGGFGSATRVHEVAQLADPVRPLVVLYLGDFDPSGMAMSEKDLPRRLACYLDGDIVPTRKTAAGWSEDYVIEFLREHGIEFRRLALTRADTRRIGRRLGFPASEKVKDANYRWFVRRCGPMCWELDAMNPVELREKLRTAITAEIDPVVWDRYVQAEAVERDSIAMYCDRMARMSGLARK